jgi:hypothetical protein
VFLIGVGFTFQVPGRSAIVPELVTDDRRATQPPAHFHRNPLGRGQLLFFHIARSTCMTQKNSQLTYGKRQVISATGH